MRTPVPVFGSQRSSVAPTTLVLLRHGHTAGNDRGDHVRMVGWTDVPLTAAGERQARELAERLAAEPAACGVYSSPLRRARDTARAVAERLRLPLVLRDDLREIFCGVADGLPVREVRVRFPEEWARNERQDDSEARWPGGESYREFRARVHAAARAIARRHAGARVLVVTHAGAISQLLGSIHGLPPARWSAWRPGNASITEIVWGRDRVALTSFDERRVSAHGADV